MTFSAANDLKEQVLEATNVVELLSSYLQLIPKGRNFVALCPFHDDTRPSLQVNPERQTWKCWPCDAGGDVFSFVMQRENVDFTGALRILAERAGIEISPRATKIQPGTANDKATLYKAMNWAEQQYYHCLLESSAAASARYYLKQRAVSKESIERYQIGFAPHEWHWLVNRAKSTSYSPEVLEAVGLVVRKDNRNAYDRFRGRVMFPIRDTQNRPIAAGGRILPEFTDENSAKYINSPETRLYTKSEQLYGLNVGREFLEQQRKQGRTRNVIVMEGYTDVVISRQEGIGAPVAVCGTALGVRHIDVLRRYADRVTLILDGDEAGQTRAAEVLELFVAGQIELRIVTLPDGLDPCDYVLKHGSNELDSLIEQAPDALDFCVARETKDIDLANDTQRANAALQRILKTMAAAPRLKEDTATVFRLREQQTLSRLARMFRVDEHLLRQQLSGSRHAAKPAFEGQSNKSLEQTELLHSWERELFMLLIQNPDAIAAVIENVSPDDVRTSSAKALLQTYRTLETQGQVADYQHVMNAIEDTVLKNILVELAEVADRTQTCDPDLQLRELLAAYASRREDRQRRKDLAELHSGKLKDEEEIELLNRLFESKRLDA